MATTIVCQGRQVVWQGPPCHKEGCYKDCSACADVKDDIVAIAEVRKILATIDEGEVNYALDRLC